MMLVYLVRHGETLFNVQGRVQGQQDVPLTETGIAQAKVLAQRLRSETFDAVYSSDLARARVTAELIAKHLNVPVCSSPLLRESKLGVVEGLTNEEIEEQYPAHSHEWRRHPESSRPPGAESISEVVSRTRSFLQELIENHPDGSRVIVVAHVGSIRGTIISALDLPEHVYRALCVSNASISILRIGAKPGLLLFNDTCHLKHVSGTADDF
jgi:broad specificity phosphatase PhoE